MPVVVIGLSHHSSPVTVRERFAFAEGDIPAALQSLRESRVADEAVILSTCNRVELYASSVLSTGEAFTALKDFLVKSRAYSEPLGDEIYALSEPQSLHHLFEVAAGLDSMVVGETEILGQLKTAYETARQHGHTSARLNKAFQRAFNAAKQIRTQTNIQRGTVSVGSVAVELAEKIFSSLQDREIMIIGAGDTGEKTARALLSRGARHILVSNRSPEKAIVLATDLGGRAVPFENWTAEFPKIDIAISSTSASHFLLDRAKLEPIMKLRRNRPLLLIDISVPRNIEPEVNFMENVYLYNIDDLQGIADRYLQQRKEEIVTCKSIIREKVDGLFGTGEGSRGSAQTRPAFDAK